MKPDVLVINTYAGSLLLAATSLGLKIRGSYEDVGYGSEIQALNFPNLDLQKKIVQFRPEWPDDDDLSNTVVIAHPPCAAFSNQNWTTGNRKGTEAASFGCHTDVMKYALSRNCKALAIESVQGAMEGARVIHDKFGKKYGYNVYRILQNAVTFGVPQWRPRFWVVFSRRPAYGIRHTPVYRGVGDILAHGEPADPMIGRGLQKIYDRFKKARFNWQGVLDEGHTGGFLTILKKVFKDEEDDTQNKLVLREKTGTKGLYHTCLPRVLAERDFASVLLSDSYFFSAGRPMNRKEYHRLMGFPDDYCWGKDEREFRKFLSKGVCPPVAAWLLREILRNEAGDPFGRICLEPGQVADLQVPRKDVIQKLKQGRLFDESGIDTRRTRRGRQDHARA